ncbi:MAG: hypothetical protein H6695_03630 [Deferribacteres bacterium]|nr:hypothetical protein [candidate division KSB1 bacterium]MCB9509240.1 hypothetical protein [Deferribacteres bacterium]
MKVKTKTAIMFCGLTMFLFCISAATAQTQQQEQGAQKGEQQQQAGDKNTGPDISTSGKKARILLDKIDVVGTLAKPQAIFIIPGTDPKVDGILVDRSFFAEIFRPVEKDFFPQKGRRKFRGAIPW